MRRYYGRLEDGLPRFTGSRFEAIAQLNSDPNSIGPADLVAITTLSVDIKGDAAVRILETDSARISELLAQIPADLKIVDADEGLLVEGSAASQLWRVLRDGRDGIGRTKTSKLMAAKRPRLIPIWDSFVEQATGLDTSDNWRQFQSVLLADGRSIWKWLGDIRNDVDDLPAEVSELRILDVLLWMSVHG